MCTIATPGFMEQWLEKRRNKLFLNTGKPSTSDNQIAGDVLPVHSTDSSTLNFTAIIPTDPNAPVFLSSGAR